MPSWLLSNPPLLLLLLPLTRLNQLDALHITYAYRSQTRVFSLHDQLACITKESHSITDYLHTLLSLSDELATAGAPMSNTERIVKILSDLGSEFREISAAIRARDTTISYEELLEKLLDCELFLLHEDSKKLSFLSQ